jgi:hypothetical protein
MQDFVHPLPIVGHEEYAGLVAGADARQVLDVDAAHREGASQVGQLSWSISDPDDELTGHFHLRRAEQAGLSRILGQSGPGNQCQKALAGTDT